MTRLKKELTDRGIIWDYADEYLMMMGPEYDTCQKLVSIDQNFITTVHYSAVLDPTFYIYDRRTLQMIAEQSVRPEYDFFGEKSRNPWGVSTMYYKDGELDHYISEPR